MRKKYIYVVFGICVIVFGYLALILTAHTKDHFIIGNDYYWHGNHIATMPDECSASSFDPLIGEVRFFACGKDHNESITILKGNIISTEESIRQHLIYQEDKKQLPIVEGKILNSFILPSDKNISMPVIIQTDGYIYGGIATFNKNTKLINIDLNERKNKNGREGFYGVITDNNTSRYYFGISPDYIDEKRNIIGLNKNHKVLVVNPFADIPLIKPH